MTGTSTTGHPPESATRTFGPRPPAARPPATQRAGVGEVLVRPATLALVVLAAVVAVTALVWPTGSTRSDASARPSPYAVVLEELDARRAAAFATGEVAALSEVYAAGAPALAEDVRVLDSYVRRGRRVAGLRHQIAAVSVLEEAGPRVRLRVVDTMPAFRVVDVAGRVLVTHAGRGERAWEVVLRRVGDEWRVAGVAAA